MNQEHIFSSLFGSSCLIYACLHCFVILLLQYECSVECQNLAPYIAGLSEETCDVFGGTWCPNPTDCTILQDCIADLMTTFRDQPRLQAFTMYLGAAPNITDPADYDQCGSTREFFGFDAGFINDDQICDDIEQLRFSRDFQFLEDFFGVGSGSSGGSEGPPEDIPPPAAEVPPLSLTMPERGTYCRQSNPFFKNDRYSLHSSCLLVRCDV